MILISGKKFNFHSNLGVPANKIKRFSTYYKRIFKRSSVNLSSFTNLSSASASHVIWYNKCIAVGKKNMILKCHKNINYVGQLFKCNDKPKLMEELNEFNLIYKLITVHI